MNPQPAEQKGTYARRLNLAADLLARVPDGLELERAATIPLAGLTATQILDWVDLTPGQSLLVNAPLGSVGRLLVQLASRAGIHVVAAVRPDDGERATAFGAAELEPERGIRVEFLLVHPDTPTLAELLEAAARGELTTAIENTYPLAQAADAHRRQGKGRLRGKLILVS